MMKRASPAPSRIEVASKLRGLLDGSLTREEASRWAAQWVAADEPDVDDDRVWRALECLLGSDIISTDRPYVYGPLDFEAWLAELEGRTPSGTT